MAGGDCNRKTNITASPDEAGTICTVGSKSQIQRVEGAGSALPSGNDPGRSGGRIGPVQELHSKLGKGGSHKVCQGVGSGGTKALGRIYGAMPMKEAPLARGLLFLCRFWVSAWWEDARGKGKMKVTGQRCAAPTPAAPDGLIFYRGCRRCSE